MAKNAEEKKKIEQMSTTNIPQTSTADINEQPPLLKPPMFLPCQCAIFIHIHGIKNQR